MEEDQAGKIHRELFRRIGREITDDDLAKIKSKDIFHLWKFLSVFLIIYHYFMTPTEL